MEGISGTYVEGMLATAGPVVRDYVITVFFAVVDEILNVVIAGVASDARNNAVEAVKVDKT